jgi:peptide/nickel transport system permease protein
MRLVDIQLAIPFILLAISIVGVLGASLRNLVLALGLAGWVTYARMVRGEVLTVKERQYVEAARALGAPSWRILLRHLLPNIISPIIVVASFSSAEMILADATLGFLGLGVPPPTPTWGGMLSDARGYLSTAWWPATFPGLSIMVTVLGINLVGDWLRDCLDPRLRL